MSPSTEWAVSPPEPNADSNPYRGVCVHVQGVCSGICVFSFFADSQKQKNSLKTDVHLFDRVKMQEYITVYSDSSRLTCWFTY